MKFLKTEATRAESNVKQMLRESTRKKIYSQDVDKGHRLPGKS